MNYDEAVKKITKYPVIVEGFNRKYIYLGDYQDGSHAGRKCYFSFLDIKEDKVILINEPKGCREMLASCFFDEHRYWDRCYSFAKMNTYRKRDFIILHAEFHIKNIVGVKKSLKIINSIENKVGIKNTKMLYNGNKRYVFIIPSEWFYNNILLSTITLLIRNSDDINLPTKKNIATLLKYREYIFDKNEPSFKYSSNGIKWFFSKLYIYSTPQEKELFNKAKEKFYEMGGV